MGDKLQEAVAEMNKAVKCLALELPEKVYWDVVERFDNLKIAIAGANWQQQQGWVSEGFLKAVSEERDRFVTEVVNQVWKTDLRVAAENILVMYDQMKAKLEELPSPPSKI